MALITALYRYFLFPPFFEGVVGLAPFWGLGSGVIFLALFSGPFFWPYFINKIPLVKTHR
jgi:hypothetical protein